MAAPREAIFEALYNRLKGLSFFKTASRKIESWDDTPPSAMPAFFLTKGPEEGGAKLLNAPSGWRLIALVYVYLKYDAMTHEADPETVPAPSTMINEAITTIELALQATTLEMVSAGAKFPGRLPGQFPTTLGGLCYSCQIVGTVQVDEGTIGEMSAVLIPIEILTTG